MNVIDPGWHLFTLLEHIDFVTAWKAISIVFTGAFGILGLATEFKNKESHKITNWGWTSLIGIILSTALGVAAQLEESAHDENDKRQVAEQTLSIAQNTAKAVRGIERTLSPINDPIVDMEFELSCSDSRYRKYCDMFLSQVRADPSRRRGNPWKGWPGAPRGSLSMRMSLFADAKKADLFLKGSQDKPNLTVEVFAFGYPSMTKRHADELEVTPLSESAGHFGDQVFFNVTENRPNHLDSDAKIVSAPDLIDSTVILTDFNENQLDHLTPRFVNIRFKNGVVCRSASFEKITVNNRRAYRFSFFEPAVAY